MHSVVPPSVTEETAGEVVELTKQSLKRRKIPIPTRDFSLPNSRCFSRWRWSSKLCLKRRVLNENHAVINWSGELPRRSRRESVKPLQWKSRLKGCLVTTLAIDSFGARILGLSYAKSALQLRPKFLNNMWEFEFQMEPIHNKLVQLLEKSGVIKMVWSLQYMPSIKTTLNWVWLLHQRAWVLRMWLKNYKGWHTWTSRSYSAELTIPKGYTLEQIAHTAGSTSRWI